jgi:hypothetical protein
MRLARWGRNRVLGGLSPVFWVSRTVPLEALWGT